MNKFEVNGIEKNGDYQLLMICKEKFLTKGEKGCVDYCEAEARVQNCWKTEDFIMKYQTTPAQNVLNSILQSEHVPKTKLVIGCACIIRLC